MNHERPAEDEDWLQQEQVSELVPDETDLEPHNKSQEGFADNFQKLFPVVLEKVDDRSRYENESLKDRKHEEKQENLQREIENNDVDKSTIEIYSKNPETMPIDTHEALKSEQRLGRQAGASKLESIGSLLSNLAYTNKPSTRNFAKTRRLTKNLNPLARIYKSKSIQARSNLAIAIGGITGTITLIFLISNLQ